MPQGALACNLMTGEELRRKRLLLGVTQKRRAQHHQGGGEVLGPRPLPRGLKAARDPLATSASQGPTERAKLFVELSTCRRRGLRGEPDVGPPPGQVGGESCSSSHRDSLTIPTPHTTQLAQRT